MTKTQTNPFADLELNNLRLIFEVAEAYSRLGDAIGAQLRSAVDYPDQPEDDDDDDNPLTEGAAGYVADRLLVPLEALGEIDEEDLAGEILAFARAVRATCRGGAR